jgi:translation initiation factor 2 subunit 2
MTTQAQDSQELNILPYTTDELVKKAYGALSQREKKKNKFIQPDIIVKDRKTFILNFDSFCKSINRDKNLVKMYLDKETNFSSSFIGEGEQIKIDTSLKVSHVKNILTIFIKLYILCPDCKSSDTCIVRKKRTNFTECNTCKSSKILNIFS